jgi:hypothetical protein
MGYATRRRASSSAASARSVRTPGRAQHAPAPAEADQATVVGPFRVRPQLRAHPFQLVHVLAELDQVPAGAFGFDAGLGDQHRLLPPVTAGLVRAPLAVAMQPWPGASQPAPDRVRWPPTTIAPAAPTGPTFAWSMACCCMTATLGRGGRGRNAPWGELLRPHPVQAGPPTGGFPAASAEAPPSVLLSSTLTGHKRLAARSSCGASPHRDRRRPTRRSPAVTTRGRCRPTDGAAIAWTTDGRRQLEPLPPTCRLSPAPGPDRHEHPRPCYWRSTLPGFSTYGIG